MRTKPTYLLGIDLGTSYLKLIIIDKRGNVLTEKRRRHPTTCPKPGYYEQDPSKWWNNLCKLISQALNDVGKRGIEGISLSGQMHGLVMVDDTGAPIVPSIIWEDNRAKDEASEIEKKIGWEHLKNVLGNKPMPGFTLPKLLWVKHNLPEVYEETGKILLPKGFLRYKLTGAFGMEVSDASSGLLINIRDRTWADDILEDLDLEQEKFPPLLESTEKAGEVTARASRETDLGTGIPVIAGAGDQQAGSVGGGIVSEGQFSATLGTGGQVHTVTNDLLVDPKGRVHTFCHCFPGEWQVMGAMKTAGRALEWLKNDVLSYSYPNQEGVSYEALDKLAKEAEPGSDGLVFLPYMAGERTPYLDPEAKGVFFGLTLDHRLPQIVRSVMEGVSFNMRYALELLLELNIHLEEILLEGGGVKSPAWSQIQADIFSEELLVTKHKYDKSAYGAAILAGLGTGILRDSNLIIQKQQNMVHKDGITPDKSTSKIYEANFKLFKKLYRSLKNLF